MSIRETTRKMTGRLTFEPEIVLGFRADGSRGVTVHFNYDAGYGCYADEEMIDQLISDLKVAKAHLRGEA